MKVENFKIVGLKIRTTNVNNQAAGDIGALWQRFLSESVSDKVPNRLSDDVYCLYTEYESDHTAPYTVLLGYHVSEMEELPDGLSMITFSGEKFEKFVAKGNLMEGVVVNTWKKIWESNLDRTYQTDFEIYGKEKTKDPSNAEVEIYIGVN